MNRESPRGLRSIIQRMGKSSVEVSSPKESWNDLLEEKMEQVSELPPRFVTKRKKKDPYGYYTVCFIY